MLLSREGRGGVNRLMWCVMQENVVGSGVVWNE